MHNVQETRGNEHIVVNKEKICFLGVFREEEKERSQHPRQHSAVRLLTQVTHTSNSHKNKLIPSYVRLFLLRTRKLILPPTRKHERRKERKNSPTFSNYTPLSLGCFADDADIARDTNLRTSSMRMTGKEKLITASHSAALRGATPKTMARNGT
jgi:hypothetical protein